MTPGSPRKPNTGAASSDRPVRLTAKAAAAELDRLGDADLAATALWFFKTAPGEYGHGDRFVGVRVPQVRRVARTFRGMPLAEAEKLLQSPIHEARLLALVILSEAFARGDSGQRKVIYDSYLANTKYVNNWDLVDVSAPAIVGQHLLTNNRRPLDRLARSTILWEKRIAIVATQTFIRLDDFADTLRLAERLLDDRHDLIHKAVGWMLREVGKRDQAVLEAFLQLHVARMPRTMLRYAIERFDEPKRQQYLMRER